MRTVIKIIITTVLLSVLLAPLGNAEARLKYYRYNDNIPMVEMSLNMMVAMGVLEPIPSRLVYDGNPYSDALFRTLKYRSEYPSLPFGSLDEVRFWVEGIVREYNTEHRHPIRDKASALRANGTRCSAKEGGGL